MSKYSEGVYQVVLFDRLGGRLDVLTTAAGLTKARALGEAVRGAGRCQSFAVLRVIHNSAEHRERWQRLREEGA